MFNIYDLKAFCENQIAKGNGNKKILLSDYEEGNGYHGLYFAFTQFEDDFVGLARETIDNKDEYIILG